jgi:hypothetical protein
MKIKATKKEMRINQFLMNVSYCKMQYLLRYQSPFAYSSGVYGWACDYYNVNGVIVSTGYAPIGECLPYETIKAYEEKAIKIACNYSLDWKEQEKQINELLHELLQLFKERIGGK